MHNPNMTRHHPRFRRLRLALPHSIEVNRSHRVGGRSLFKFPLSRCFWYITVLGRLLTSLSTFDKFVPPVLCLLSEVSRSLFALLPLTMADWYLVLCEELCELIEQCLGTSVYQDKLKEGQIDGDSFFNMPSEEDWSLFYQCVGMKSFSHMIKLKRWVAQCKESSAIVFQLKSGGLNPSVRSSGDNHSVSRSFSTSQSESCVVQQHVPQDVQQEKFYPAPAEIFTKGGGKVLSDHKDGKYKDAYLANLKNMATVREWFAAADHDPVDPEIYEYMAADYKLNSEVKERCKVYMRTKMEELLPLPFECPITHAKHHIPWPDDWVFHRILQRKHEWRKAQAKLKKEGNS